MALQRTGYAGGIGGSVHTNPEFLLARGGELAWMPSGFIGHSQQCMLHGECASGVYAEAFDLAYETGGLFGYLDHPFSERYQYGWSDEEQRGAVHEQLITHIRARAARPLFMSEDEAMDFLLWRSLVRVVVEDEQLFIDGPPYPHLTLAVEYRGKVMEGIPLWAVP